MKIYKSFSLLKHVRRILALEDDLMREFMLQFFNELEDLCHWITFLMVILFKLMVNMFRTVNWLIEIIFICERMYLKLFP